MLRCVLRWAYIALTWFVAIAVPFFGDFLSLVGSVSFVPLTFVIPCTLYLIRQRQAEKAVSPLANAAIYVIIVSTFLVGIVATVASIYGIVQDASTYKLFM
jgi:amino acid permease